MSVEGLIICFALGYISWSGVLYLKDRLFPEKMPEMGEDEKKFLELL
jgi:hypothetical protein